MSPAEQALLEQARADLASLAYPDRPWVRPVTIAGEDCADVLVVGGGQSGLAIAHGLRRNGVLRVAVLDAAPAGQEGVWEDFARMPELRTPKHQNGLDFGQPSLSVQRWFVARHGEAAWDQITRIPRRDWMAYLRWYRTVLALDIENEVTVTGITPGPAGVLQVATTRGLRLARSVVLCTGFDGGGSWRVLPAIAAGLPADRYDHACTRIDFERLRGKRLGIIGHGASAFDAAVVALEHGATSVDLCFRRAALPVVNPHRHLETAGMMANWPALSDPVRWAIARHMRAVDQPPATASYRNAVAQAGFRMHAGCPWEAVTLEHGDIRVATPHGPFHFDHVISATGYALDLAARPELHALAGRVAVWRDRYRPPVAEASAELEAFPYLGPGYEFLPRDPAEAWISRVHVFNFASYVSLGPHSTSISGHKHAVPRLVRSLVRRLLLEQEDAIVGALQAYGEVDLVVVPAALEKGLP